MNLRRKLLAFLQSQKKGAEYTELEYLESDGNQYINLGIIPNNTMGVKAKFYVNSASGKNYVVGSRGNSVGRFYLYSTEDSAYVRYGWGAFYTTNITPVVGTPVEASLNYLNDRKYIYNGTEVNSNLPQTDFSGNTYDMYLFSSNFANVFYNDAILKGRIYYCQITQGDKVIMDLIPVLDKDFTPCMYDKVSGRFFYNQGDGEFKWKLPNQLEYLGVDGTQWIDTGFAPSSNTRVVGSVLFKEWLGTANYVFGVYGDNANFGFNVGSARTYFNVPWYNNSGIRVSLMPSFNTVFNYDISKDGLYVNGQLFTDPLLTMEFQSQKTMYIGWCNWTTQNKMSGRIYTHKIYENEVLIHYLIPVFDENLICCMYDLVSKQYFRNQGTGSFKGYFEDGSQLVGYLESTGTQWIDTGFIPNENQKLEVVGYSPKVNTGVSLVGTRNASDYNNRLQIWSDTSGYFSARINASTFITNYPSTVKSTIVLDIKNKNFTVNNSEAYALNYTGSLAVNSYVLFLRNNGSGGVDANYADPVIIYSFKIWENDKLIQYLLPVLNSSGTPCMYDVVSGKSLPNAGTGTFNYGEIE